MHADVLNKITGNKLFASRKDVKQWRDRNYSPIQKRGHFRWGPMQVTEAEMGWKVKPVL